MLATPAFQVGVARVMETCWAEEPDEPQAESRSEPAARAAASRRTFFIDVPRGSDGEVLDQGVVARVRLASDQKASRCPASTTA
ncbi:hypothetical protein PSA01_21380 [Pseudonocardia saturnea]|uniref:Uncharacterized protein n=1 Tax=Pseudonocardia saturnea TaxID=33909 RepID=A0ABQ0RWQ6_9PSEU|nr:hypothetical protein PSA01_21380 [Pseudonocardia saturnea]